MDSQDENVERRLRRYAQGFRREADPPVNLATRLIAGLGEGQKPAGAFGIMPAIAMAALVLVVGIGIAFGAWQLKAIGRATASPQATITATANPTPVATPSVSPSTSPVATPSPSPTPSGAIPQGVPALASIQMVGPHLGWAVGSHAIYATTDGTHWVKQLSSTDDFVGVDFISSNIGWAVGGHSLLGTVDGGRNWTQLGEPRELIRSVHFINANQGWGVAGGNQQLVMHGVLMPLSGGTVVISQDGGQSWSNLNSPADPQSICFSSATRGWLVTQAGRVYTSQNSGQTWRQVLQMASGEAGPIGWGRVECAAPSAAWVQWAPRGAAAGHSPYVVYATLNGGAGWRTVMAEPGTIGNLLPGVPAGPGSYPGSFSVVDPSDAVFVGDTPAANSATCMIATNGGATLKQTGAVPGAWETFDAAFVSTTTGWVLAVNGTGGAAIYATSDGGYHWSQQLAVKLSGS